MLGMRQTTPDEFAITEKTMFVLPCGTSFDNANEAKRYVEAAKFYQWYANNPIQVFDEDIIHKLSADDVGNWLQDNREQVLEFLSRMKDLQPRDNSKETT